MKRFIIKETTIRTENHPAYINEWFVGKDGQCGEATLPLKFVAREHGWASRGWAEKRIAEKLLSDRELQARYELDYRNTYEIVEVEV